jgi:hypothetical protein
MLHNLRRNSVIEDAKSTEKRLISKNFLSKTGQQKKRKEADERVGRRIGKEFLVSER